MILGTLLRGRRSSVQEVVVASRPPVPPVLTRSELITAIIFAAQDVKLTTTEQAAEALIRLWERAREDANGPARPHGRRTETLLHNDELGGGAHAIMEVLMPDEQIAEPGTVHDELNRHVFGVDADGRARRGVVHTMDSTDRCAVVVVVVAG